MNLHDLRLRLRAVFCFSRVERELDEELSFHVERETRKHIAGGLSPAAARARAQARFGSAVRAAEECRDARGIGPLDNTVRDLLYAFRTFRRAPLVALTIVTTVALGLGLVAVVFSILNAVIFRVDAVRNPGELFAVERPRVPGSGDRVRFTLPQYDALRRETNLFSGVFAMLQDIDSRIDGRMMAGTLVTGNFFQVLGVSASLGRTLLPEDDERSAGVVVLSHRGWSRLFRSDPGAIGRPLRVGGITYEVVGVMPEGFRGLSVVAPDYFAPISLLGQIRPFHAGRENFVGVDVIGRLGAGISRRTAMAGLAVWASGGARRGSVEARTEAIVLERRDGTVPWRMEAVAIFAPLFVAFGLILLTACANVANLLLARAVSRQREIGIRLSLGASRRRVVRQLLTESLLLALAAAALAYVISRAILQAIIHAATVTMPPDIGDVRLFVPAGDWRVVLFLVAGAIAATATFGFAPALQATRLELVRTMRGEVTRDARPGRSRSVLIGLQVGASALLLIAAAVFLRSAGVSADPGIRTGDTLLIEIVNEPVRTAMVRAVATDPLVAEVAASWPTAVDQPRAAFATSGSTAVTVGYRLASPEYFSALDIQVLRGRGFTAADGPRAPVVLVSQSTARELWPDVDAVGQVLQLEADPTSEPRRRDEPLLPARSFTVVGVVRDVAGFRLAGYREAGVYVPTDATVPRTSLVVRAHGDPHVAREALLERLVLVDPNMGHVLTMETLARMDTYLLQVAFAVTLALGGLALVLTASGLFSVLSYLVEQRTREIGVRMAIGAGTAGVVRLVLRQSVRPVTAGLAAGAALAAAIAVLLLSTPAAEQIGTFVRVFDPVAYAASLLFIVAACILAASIPAYRAAHIDPIAALRQE